MSGFLLSVFLLFSIVRAENYAIIYASVEHLTNTELPSSACRIYDYLISNNFEKKNIVYMLDTSDYNMDYTDVYSSWFDGNNIHLRDDFYHGVCSDIDFEGEYVTPKFLLYYLIGDKTNIKKLSGKSEPRMLNTSKEDTILVYFSDTHGRGSEYHHDRIVDPDLVKKAVLIMKKNKLFKSLLFLAEAGYADHAFHKLERMKNVVALTLKDVSDSSFFTHLYPGEEEDTYDYVQSFWDGTWPSLLPLACGETIQYLHQLATSATLQMLGHLLMPGIYGDHNILEKKLSKFIPVKESCHRFFFQKTGSVDKDGIQDILSSTYVKNFNNTIPMQQTRQAFYKYSQFMEGVITQFQEKEVEENTDLPIQLLGCVDYLMYNMRMSCDYFMPLYDSIVSAFTLKCAERKEDGFLMVDFKPFCSKNNPEENLW